ncbi:MAG: 1-acyl-sn-glycerol-3-phosphate acyltransferase, partial [Bacteroidota bacterium]
MDQIMLYRLLRAFFLLACRIYFRKIQVHGPALPEGRPFLLVANHPSALLDAIVLAVISNRPLYFLARGESFDKGWKRFLWRCLHMIPIYRKAHTPELTRRNPGIFRYCHHLFDSGEGILIFPEGISKTEPRLRPIKTGAAQIALGYESVNGVDLALIPVGLNYSKPSQFRSELCINMGAEIPLAEDRALAVENPRKAVQQLSHRIQLALRQLTVVIDDPSDEALVEHLELHYKEELLRKAPILRRPGLRSFLLTKDIVRAVDHFQAEAKPAAKDLSTRIANYSLRLEAFGLRRFRWPVPSAHQSTWCRRCHQLLFL